jgi:hypothetical protein
MPREIELACHEGLVRQLNAKQESPCLRIAPISMGMEAFSRMFTLAAGRLLILSPTCLAFRPKVCAVSASRS